MLHEAFQGSPCLPAKAELLAPPASLAKELWEKVAEWLGRCPLLEALDPRINGSHQHDPNQGHSRRSIEVAAGGGGGTPPAAAVAVAVEVVGVEGTVGALGVAAVVGVVVLSRTSIGAL